MSDTDKPKKTYRQPYPFHLPEDLRNRIALKAKANHRSINSEMIVAVERHVRDDE